MTAADRGNADTAERRPTATAVHGIKAQFAASTHKDRLGVKRKRYSPVFRVQVLSVSGEWINRSFPLLRDGLERAWSDAVACVARARGLRRWAHLRRLRPDPAQFEALRRSMIERGHDVPESQLPGLRPAREYKPAPAPERRSTEAEPPIKRTHTKVLLLDHLARHGRTDPTRLGRLYFEHVQAKRTKDSDATVRRAAARAALNRMANYGLVRILVDGDAKITASGRRYLESD